MKQINSRLARAEMETRSADAWSEHIDKTCERDKRHFILETRRVVLEAEVLPRKAGRLTDYASWQQYNDCAMYATSKFDWGIFAGGIMEKVAEELEVINLEVEESKKLLRSLYNDLMSLHRQITPEIIAQVQEVRKMRMTIVGEIQQSITAMKDIRKFFIETDHSAEMARLREFVDVCKDLMKLKEAGVLDAICDTVLITACKEGGKGHD